MKKLVPFGSCAVLGLLLVLAAPMKTQAVDVNAKIRGTVTDPSGAVIAGATLTATNTGTGVSSATTSGTDGSYEFLQLPAPSTYDLKCEKSGFKIFAARHIRLTVTQIFVQDIQMELGQITQEVTVEATPNQIERTSIELGTSVSANQIVDLPLNGRNWTQLQQTLPGVVAASDGRGNYATNGSQTDQNNFLVNGVDTNDLPLNTPLVIPSPDAIAEFHLVTNTINPEYGRNSGAIMNAVTKAGTNSFHGSGFEFFRDTGLNSRNFFQQSPAVFHQHQFGGTVGGPVWKEHTFFFFSYQGTRNRNLQSGAVPSVSVFSPDERNGSFPDIATSTTPSPFPLTGENGTVYPAGTPYSTIFPTGNIPVSDFNSISATLLQKYIPLPTNGTDFQFNPITTGKGDQYISRIDHNFSSKDEIWGYWFWEIRPTLDTLPFTGSTLPGFPQTSQRHIQEYVLTWNHTFGPTMLNEARFGYTRLNFVAVQPVNILNPQSVGFTGINTQHPEASSWPRISVISTAGPAFDLGFSSNGPQPRIDQTYQVDDNLTKIVGRHTIKLGFDMRRFQVYNPFFGNINGTFNFGGSGLYTTGDGGADFLLGIPDSYAQGGGDIINARAQEYYTYFQDQFRLRPNLTLTFGTGWSVDTPLVDIYHANHAMIAFRPGQQSTVFPNAPPGYLFQGDPGVHAGGTTKYGHFGPRFGFAWSPSSASPWAIRGGYGIYFNRSLEEQSLQFLGDPPYSVASGGAADIAGLSPAFATPFVDIAGNGSEANKFPAATNPPSSTGFAQFEPINFLMVMDPHTSVPYAQNFNLSIERQLGGTTTLSLAYVGSLARHLVIVRELNPGINAAGCAADPSCVAGRVDQNVSFPNNFPYPGNVLAGIANNQTTGTSNYNSLQAKLDKRVSRGLQFFVAYTYSKAMDDGSGFEDSAFGGGGFGGFGSLRATNPFNQTAADYGPSVYDATHRFVINYSYDIPAVRHFNNWAAKRFFEGWRMNGITTYQTGFPLDVVDAAFRSLTCTENIFSACWDVPNVIASAHYVDPRTSQLINATKGGTTTRNHYWFDPNTFARETIGTIGNAARDPLRGPGIANFDWGFYKDTPLTERTRLELRFEFFNLWNHTQFSPNGLSTNINSGNFGRVSNALNPRIVQLAAKIYF